MSLSDVRKKLGLTQSEFAILTDVPLGSIRHYEQRTCCANRALMTLTKLLSDKKNVIHLVRIACERRYKDITEVRALLSLLRKSGIRGLDCSLFEVQILGNHQQFLPQELGFKTTTI